MLRSFSYCLLFVLKSIEHSRRPFFTKRSLQIKIGIWLRSIRTNENSDEMTYQNSFLRLVKVTFGYLRLKPLGFLSLTRLSIRWIIATRNTSDGFFVESNFCIPSWICCTVFNSRCNSPIKFLLDSVSKRILFMDVVRLVYFCYVWFNLWFSSTTELAISDWAFSE